MEPMISEENVLLRLKLNKFVVFEDGVEEVILSRYNNAIVELKNGEILSCFRFVEMFTIVQQLKIFYSYEPKFKHYVFLNGSDLVIVRKADGVIKLYKIYKGVSNYDIADSCNTGRPHIHIFQANQETPIVTNCINDESIPRETSNRVQGFAPYVQKSMMRIKKAEEMLQEKTKMISKLSNVLAFNCDDDKILSTTDRVVFLKEGLTSACVGLAAKGNILSVGKPWLKMHLGNWIIGFPIVNISKSDVFNFEMVITHQCITVKKTILFTKIDTAGEVDFYGQSVVLLQEQFGVLVAVMNEPFLTQKTFTLTCVSGFERKNSNEAEQTFLGCLEVNAVGPGENQNYLLFSPHLSANDLMSIQAALKSFELYFTSTLNVTELLNLIGSFKPFQKMSEYVFVNSTTSSFPLLVILDPNKNQIRAFSNSENDFLRVFHKLSDNLKETVTFVNQKNHSLKVVDAILKEIKYIKGMMIHEVIESESNGSPTIPINLEEAFRDMMQLEGANSSGQLGQLKKCEECLTPVQVPLDHISLEPEDIASIEAGASHSFLLTENGTVYGCGSNARGQLADSLLDEQPRFNAIPSLSTEKIKQLATKWDTSYAITSDNVCLAWGPNNFNQIGVSTKENVHSPQVVSSNVTQVAAGLRHALFLNCDGSVSSAGDGKRGQLGRQSSSTLEKISGLEGIIQIACGQNHNLALTKDGKVLGWGCNKFRQLAVEEQIEGKPVVVCEVESTACKLLCGWTHSTILDDNGKLISWGRNKYGQLGMTPSPFQDKPQELKFKPLKRVAFGSEHTIAITIDNELVSWGWNEHGSCGSGDTADVFFPTVVDVGGVPVKIGAGTGQSFAITSVSTSPLS